MDTDYPFVVGNKVIKVTASGIKNAINRITSKHQNKFINITHAKNMDLISAKVEAAKLSRSEHKKKYIIVDDEGECFIDNAPLKGVLHCYNNGSEIALENDAPVTTTVPRPNKKKLPAQSEKAQKMINKKEGKESAANEIDSTKTKNMATKPAKKAAAKKVKATASKEPKVKKIARGNNMFLTEEEWKKVDKLLEKEQVSFSAWSRNLVLAKIK